VIVLEGSTVIVCVRVRRSVRVGVPVYGIVTDVSPVRLTVVQDDTDTEVLCDGVFEVVVLCVSVWVSRKDTDTPELLDLTGVDEVVFVDEKELVGVVLPDDVWLSCADRVKDGELVLEEVGLGRRDTVLLPVSLDDTVFPRVPVGVDDCELFIVFDVLGERDTFIE